MIRKWLAIFKKDTLMDRAYKRSYEMLDLTREMYLQSSESLRQKEDSEIDVSIKEKDKAVNKYEREVRRDVLKHLAFGEAADLPSGLMLASIIIDIERIGDFTKNMVELALAHPGKLTGRKFENEVKKIEDAISEEFQRTRTCIEKGDTEAGRKILEDYFWINKACDSIVLGIVREEDKSLPAGDAAALAVYVRWLKRINSHLRNITTSVVNPFDRIGFEPKNKKR